MLLQTQIQLTKRKEKVLKPKEQKKQSSISTQISENLLSESLICFKFYCRQKFSF